LNFEMSRLLPFAGTLLFAVFCLTIPARLAEHHAGQVSAVLQNEVLLSNGDSLDDAPEGVEVGQTIRKESWQTGTWVSDTYHEWPPAPVLFVLGALGPGLWIAWILVRRRRDRAGTFARGELAVLMLLAIGLYCVGVSTFGLAAFAGAIALGVLALWRLQPNLPSVVERAYRRGQLGRPDPRRTRLTGRLREPVGIAWYRVQITSENRKSLDERFLTTHGAGVIELDTGEPVVLRPAPDVYLGRPRGSWKPILREHLPAMLVAHLKDKEEVRAWARHAMLPAGRRVTVVGTNADPIVSAGDASSYRTQERTRTLDLTALW
jgi:hypothetical protein